MDFKHTSAYIKITYLVIAVFIISATLLIQPPLARADTGVINGSVVNVRSGPGTNFDIAGTIYQDTEVTILASQNGWSKVQLGNLTGWVSTSLINIKQTVKVKVTGDLVNLRSGPGTTYDKSGSAVKGDIFTLISTENDWYKVTDNGGNTHYIATFLAQKIDASTTPGNASGQNNPAPSVDGQKKIQILSGPINVRSGPGTNHDQVGMVGDQAVFSVLGQEANWYKIQLADGRTAWVAGWLVKVVESSSPAPQPQPVPQPQPGNSSNAPVVFLDGKQLSFEVPPVIENDRTLVPLRAIFEAMGASVNWNNDTRTVTSTKGTTTVVLPIGSTNPVVNGITQKIDVPAKIVNDRTLAPLRFVGEAFGGKVGWDNNTRTITITSPVITPPAKPDNPVNSGNDKKYQVAEINEAQVNLRSGPANAYDKIDTAYPGEKLVVLDEKDGWYQVSRGGTRAWLAGWMVDVAWQEGEPVIPPVTSQEPEKPKPDPDPIVKPDKPSADVIWLSSSKDENGIKIIMASGKKLKADIKETKTNVTYTFEDRKIDGLNFIKETVAGKDMKVKGRNEGDNAIVEIEFPSGTEYLTSSETGGSKEIFTVPNFISGVERKPFGSGGERVIIKTIAPVKSSASEKNDRLEVTLENVLMGKARGEYEYKSELLDGMTVKEDGKNTILIIETKDLGKYAFGAGGDGNDLNIILTGKKNIKPVKENLVVIDPGHGGTESGARGNGLLEKDVNLDIALRVGKILEKKGIEVEYTRTTDATVGLEERSKIANRLNAALFVSIHNNANGSNDKQGTETHYYAPVDNPELFLQKAERERLATVIQKHMMSNLKRINRGVKQSNFSVLRNTQMPSVLAEVVFISNPEEAELLTRTEFKNLAAEGIAEGIAEYMGK
ncbi:MAG: N-acetylmuramoyl-L-alanine amidase [Syntrophomonadaceae bacterium]|nr:N-acetylmuramoyl-L-alanine amidase [Syntrophomonadaceae bacterium]